MLRTGRLLLLLLTATPLVAQTLPTTSPALESTVDRLVADLGHSDPDRRRAATARLESLAPDVLPLLESHRDHPDAEIATRVRTIISAFSWTRDGAIITNVADASPAARADLRVGDVILKVNDTDIAHEWELDRARDRNPTADTFHVWRAGKIRTLELPNGWLGITCAGWDQLRGGVDQSRGIILAQAHEGHTEAFRLLKAARKSGMDDPWTLGLLASLAERHLDHATAASAYEQMHTSLPGCWRTHASTDLYYFNLPFNGPHADHLLTHLRRQPLTGYMAHELFDFATRHGRNLPLARDVAARPQPIEPATTNDHWRFYDMAARMMIAHHDRHYDDALNAFDNTFFIPGTTQDLPREYAIRSAVAAGKTPHAAQIAADTIRKYANTPNATGTIAHAFLALAAARAAGDDDAASTIETELPRLGRDTLAAALALEPTPQLFLHPALRSKARPTIERWLAGDRPTALRRPILTLAATDENLTAEGWHSAVAQWQITPDVADIDVTAQLRLGNFAEARKRLADDTDAELRKSIEIIERHAPAWAALTPPVTQVIRAWPARDKDTFWALRYDGRLFQIAAGASHEFPGLPTSHTPPLATDNPLTVNNTSTTFRLHGSRNDDPGNPSEFFVLDEKQNRWVDATQSKLPVDLPDPLDTATLALLRFADAHHPLPGPPRQFSAALHGHFATLWMEGNLLLLHETKTNTTRDVSTEIEKLAGKPVDAYRIHPTPTALFLPTDAGLWRFDLNSAKLTRIPLALPDDNVRVSILKEPLWFPDKDKLLVGVAPQVGGQIVEIDLTTLTPRVTAGFCGLGPDDWFATHRTTRPLECLQSIDRLYRARLAK